MTADLPISASGFQIFVSYFFGDSSNPDVEGLDLPSELNAPSQDEKNLFLDRWRRDLEWWKKQHSHPEWLKGSD